MHHSEHSNQRRNETCIKTKGGRQRCESQRWQDGMQTVPPRIALVQTQPVGFGRPAILHACLAGP